MYLCQGSPSVKLLYTLNRQGLKWWEFPSFSTVWTKKKKLQCRFFFQSTSLMQIYISCLLLLPAVEFNLSHLKGGNKQWKPSVCVGLLSDWHLFSCFRDYHNQRSMAALLANFTSYQAISSLLLRLFFFLLHVSFPFIIVCDKRTWPKHWSSLRLSTPCFYLFLRLTSGHQTHNFRLIIY